MKKLLIVAILAVSTLVSVQPAEARNGNVGAAIAGGIIGGVIAGGIIAHSHQPRPQRWLCTTQNKFGTLFQATGWDPEETAERAYGRCSYRFRRCFDMGCRPY